MRMKIVTMRMMIVTMPNLNFKRIQEQTERAWPGPRPVSPLTRTPRRAPDMWLVVSHPLAAHRAAARQGAVHRPGPTSRR